MQFPIEIYKDKNGILSEFENPIIRQTKYYLEIEYLNNTKKDSHTLDKLILKEKYKFTLRYFSSNKNVELNFSEIINYINTKNNYGV